MAEPLLVENAWRQGIPRCPGWYTVRWDAEAFPLRVLIVVNGGDTLWAYDETDNPEWLNPEDDSDDATALWQVADGPLSPEERAALPWFWCQINRVGIGGYHVREVERASPPELPPDGIIAVQGQNASEARHLAIQHMLNHSDVAGDRHG